MFGVSVNSGVKPVNPCDLKKGETFYIFLRGGLDFINGLTRIEKRQVEEITTWEEHWFVPDYLGGNEDSRECRLVYSFQDEDTGKVDRVVVPKVPRDWLVFRTEKDAAQYAVDCLKAEEEELKKNLASLIDLKERFQKLL